MVRGSDAGKGSTQAINRQLRAHPIGFPLALLVGGASLLLLSMFVIDIFNATPQVRSSIWFDIFFIGLGALAFLLGVVMLPIGVVITVSRRRNATPLRCPSCGLTRAESAKPFRIEHVPGVSYIMVRCPRCGYDFTVDRYSKLT